VKKQAKRSDGESASKWNIGDYNAPGFSVKLVGERAVEVIPIGWNGTGTKGSIEIVNITPHGRGIFEIVLLENGWNIFEAVG
jgi:hypothetical protein